MIGAGKCIHGYKVPYVLRVVDPAEGEFSVLLVVCCDRLERNPYLVLRNQAVRECGISDSGNCPLDQRSRACSRTLSI